MIAELRTFIAVARYGTFAAAGDRVGLTQGAVSGHIRRLEEHLGFDLFDRSGRSAILTPEGARTLERSKELISLFSALGNSVSDSNIDARVKIGAIASLQPTLLSQALPSFRTRFPRVQLHISPGVSLHLLDQLDSGEIDLAILIRPSFGMPSNLAWQRLHQEPYILLAPASTTGSNWRKLIEQHPFLRYERTSLGGRQVDRFLRSQAIQPTESAELDDLPSLVAMVAQGLGIAIVPLAQALLPLPDNVRTVSLKEHTFVREVGLARRRTAQSHFMDHLVQCIGEAARNREPSIPTSKRPPRRASQ